MANVVRRGQVTGPRRLGLPAEATSFVGRSAELAGITELLRTARMLTVTGVAGVGKTRTSVYAASQLAGQFPDGVWFADFGAVSDPGLVPGTVAAALGDRVAPAEKKRRSQVLRGRSELRSRRHRASRLGHRERVLIDKVADTQCSGYTADYTRC
ncbi:MAG TPA: hypothetical protein VHV09_19550, partial [Trebonia sp.]|nr:hypothetical protein [Trebonia sp.]